MYEKVQLYYNCHTGRKPDSLTFSASFTLTVFIDSTNSRLIFSSAFAFEDFNSDFTSCILFLGFLDKCCSLMALFSVFAFLLLEFVACLPVKVNSCIKD